jgi:hypothetical protein
MLSIEISCLFAKYILKSDVPITIPELWERVEEATVNVTYNNANLLFCFTESLFRKILHLIFGNITSNMLLLFIQKLTSLYAQLSPISIINVNYYSVHNKE